MDIANNCVVSIHYTLTDEAGETLDTSSGGDPLNYLHGHNGLIPGLEKELAGRVVGDAFQAVIQPEDAYGMVDREMVQEVPLEALAGIENLSVGMQLQAQGQDGSVQVVVVDAMGEETATLNGNHVLAGQVLTFDVTVESVREASAEELEHGHAH